MKGIGLDHEKFSPVCTAFYRLVPRIEIDPAITANGKKIAVEICLTGVLEIDESGKLIVHEKKCMSCRECLRNPRVASFLKVGQESGHLEFTLESIGVRSANRLVKEALELLRARWREVREAVEQARGQLEK
jgi:DNA-directed RNA polymerase I and III subunit RPAC1